MTSADIAVLVFVSICGFWMARGGATDVFVGTAVTVAAVWAVLNWSQRGDELLAHVWEPPVPLLFGGLLVLSAVLLVGIWLSALVSRIKALLGLEPLDYLLGFGLGIFMGGAITWCLLVGARYAVADVEQRAWWRSSWSVPLIARYGDYLWEHQARVAWSSIWDRSAEGGVRSGRSE